MWGTQQASEFGLADSVLRRFLAIHEQHRDLETVTRLELWIGRDVDLVDGDRQSRLLTDARDERFHVVAQMTARSRVDGESNHEGAIAARHSAAMRSAAARGSFAAMLGR